jgi:hypothetical protein
MSSVLPLLIVGAGPFGLAMARYARLHDIRHRVVGRPMAFWRESMPAGMLLRSGTSWHLDPIGELTFARWTAEHGFAAEELQPLALDRYLDYVDWYRRAAGIEVDNTLVEKLEVASSDDHGGGRSGTSPADRGKAPLDPREAGILRATLADGRTLHARNVLLAVGFGYFQHLPDDPVVLVPADRRAHTADLVDVTPMRGQRVLIVGGRQSAFETAALLCDCGASAVYLSHRHPSPAIAESDWSWVEAMVTRLAEEPDWYRRQSSEERGRVDRRFWEEGRLKVEPWLGPRLDTAVVTCMPSTQVVDCRTDADGALTVRLAPAGDPGQPAASQPAASQPAVIQPAVSQPAVIQVDRVIFATGYKVDMARVPFLDPDLLDRLELDDGFPRLDPGFQSRVPGLFVTSMPATRDFGAFLAFTVSVRAATLVTGRAIRARLRVGGVEGREG